MMTADAALCHAVSGEGDARTLTLDPAFQGLPDTAHGGTVLAAFESLAGFRGARLVAGHYRRRVPVATALRLAVSAHDDGLACRLADHEGVLVDGRVVGASPAGQPPPMPDGRGAPLPVSRTCFACGIDNPLGLGVSLRCDDGLVWSRWSPRAGFRRADGSLAPIALTTLLDEAAFWLGALATGESGMTTELNVTLHGDAAADAVVTLVGDRSTVRPRAGDTRYWETTGAALDERGQLLATAAITFVAVRGAARRLVTGLLSLNPPETLRRVFPAYTRG